MKNKKVKLLTTLAVTAIAVALFFMPIPVQAQIVSGNTNVPSIMQFFQYNLPLNMTFKLENSSVTLDDYTFTAAVIGVNVLTITQKTRNGDNDLTSIKIDVTAENCRVLSPELNATFSMLSIHIDAESNTVSYSATALTYVSLYQILREA